MKMQDESPDFNLAAPCGSYCGQCNYYRRGCAGCGYVKGKPSWGNAASSRA